MNMKRLALLLLSVFIFVAASAQSKHKGKPAVARKGHISSHKTASGRSRNSTARKKVAKKVILPPEVAKKDSTISPVVDNLLTVLARELGKPYRLGSYGPTGFDCSGLMKFAFSFIGIALPRTASDIGQLGEKIAMNDLHPGDLLFFSGRRASHSNIGHVGCVYKVDSGKVYMIHSSQEGVNILDITNSEYYKKRLIYAKRIFPEDSCIAPGKKGKG